MISHNPWTRFFLYSVSLLILAFIIGLIIHQVFLMLFIASTGLLIWNYYHFYHLESWLRKSRKTVPPEASGIWGALLDHIHFLRQRDKQRSVNLASLLKRFKTSAMALPDAVISINNQAEIEWWNDIASSMLGLIWPQDRHQRLDNLIRHPRFAEYYRSRDYSKPITIPSPNDDTIQLEVRIVDYGENQRLIIARDISESIRVQQMRRDFVANVSHELKTPLTVLHGAAESLSDARDEIAPDLHPLLNLLEQQSSRMASLVHDLLTLSRLEAGNDIDVEPSLPLIQIINQLATEARALGAELNHNVIVDIDETLTIPGNQNEITSCFSNLISNAVRHTPENGTISIRWYRLKEQACFEVEDNGIGISEEHLPRITERFYRVDPGRSRNTGGTGLGLAIVKRILLRHNGTLEIESTQGQGSTFRCCFKNTPPKAV